MRSRCPPEYTIPDDPDAGKMDAAYLRTCLGLRTPIGETPPQLPVAVRRAHYDMARSLSLLGAIGPNGMDATQLAIVVALALRDPEMELPKRDGEQSETAGELVTSGVVIDSATMARGQKVVVFWRNKDQAGHFLGFSPVNGRLVVLLNGNEMHFRPDLVRLPTEGEFPEVAENINQPAEVT